MEIEFAVGGATLWHNLHNAIISFYNLKIIIFSIAFIGYRLLCLH